MNKIIKIFSSLICLMLLSSASFSQSNDFQWNKLIKQHNDIEIINDYYVDKFSAVPLIFIDSIAIIEPIKTDTKNLANGKIKEIFQKIKYPEIAKRAGLEGSVVLSAIIDTAGNIKNIEVELSDAEMFNKSAIDALKSTKFIPIIENSRPIEVRIGIAFSFVMKKKKNFQIDTIIVHVSPCFGKCPSYTIILNKNGEVTYDGQYYVDKIGK